MCTGDFRGLYRAEDYLEPELSYRRLCVAAVVAEKQGQILFKNIQFP